MKNISLLTVCFFVALSMGCAAGHQNISFDQPPKEANSTFSKRHQKLYNAFDGYHKVFYDYAHSNGYSSDLAAKVIVLHEILHVDSAAHLAFSTPKGYLGPYVGDSKWPGADFEYIVDQMNTSDIKQTGDLYRKYILRNPQNSLLNIIDEINVYSQTVSYLEDDPAYEKYKGYMSEYLYFLDIYFRILRDKQNDAYVKLYEDSKTAKLIYTVIMQANGQYDKKEKKDMSPHLENINDFMNNIFVIHMKKENS